MLLDIGWFALGLALAGLTIRPLLRFGPETQRRLSALYLVIAGLIYVGFGLAWGDGGWLWTEVGGAALCAVFAGLGLWHHPLWIAVGWGLHPIWDVGVHLLGPGAHVAPRWYAIACLSFDVLFAAWFARRHGRRPSAG